MIEKADIRQIAVVFAAIFRPVEACCKDIRLVADCPGSQIVGLTTSKRWNSLLSLHQGTCRPSVPLHVYLC